MPLGLMFYFLMPWHSDMFKCDLSVQIQSVVRSIRLVTETSKMGKLVYGL